MPGARSRRSSAADSEVRAAPSPAPALVHRALRWAGETRSRCGGVNLKEHSVFTTRLALGFAVVLAAASPSLPASASADYPSPANIARTAHGIDYAAYVVRRGAYGRTVVRRGPYRTVVRTAIAHPITAVWSSADRITDIAPPITAT